MVHTVCFGCEPLKGSSLNPPLSYWQINWGFDLWCRSRQKVAFLRSLLEPFTNTRSGIRFIGIPSLKLYMTYIFEPWGWTNRESESVTSLATLRDADVLQYGFNFVGNVPESLQFSKRQQKLGFSDSKMRFHVHGKLWQQNRHTIPSKHASFSTILFSINRAYRWEANIYWLLLDVTHP